MYTLSFTIGYDYIVEAMKAHIMHFLFLTFTISHSQLVHGVHMRIAHLCVHV
jgi:hypothetical protein